MPGALRYDPVTAEDIALGVGGYTVTNPAGGQLANSRFNLGNLSLKGGTTWAPAAVAASSSVTEDVSCLGARVGFPALCTFSGTLGHSNRSLHAEVITNDVVRVFLVNNDTVSTLTVGSGVLAVFAFPVPIT